jgi:hypothetical protein
MAAYPRPATAPEWGLSAMGILRRLGGFGGQKWPPRGPITTWPGDTMPDHLDVSAYLFPPVGRSVVDVVGEGFCQGTLEQIGGGKTIDGMRNRDHTALLIPEPANPYDQNAVRVVLVPSTPGVSAGRIGYLSREDAVTYRPIIDRLAAGGQVMAARASLQGGWDRGPNDRGMIGVVLHMGTVADCQAELLKEPPTPSWR